MEQIIQLKSMRDAALERLQNNPDFKLVNSLDALILDLESVMMPAVETMVEEPVEAIEEITTDTFEIAAESETASFVNEPEAVESEALETNSAEEAPVEVAETSISEELSELAADQTDEALSAIEALEAELSQSDIGSEEIDIPSGQMVN